MKDDELVLQLLSTAVTLSQMLDRSLSAVKGISFSEFQLMSALAEQPNSSATRVGLAKSVGLTPSGVTRALKPLEKLGFLRTERDFRDARRSIAALTPAGQELVDDARGVVADTIAANSRITSLSNQQRTSLEVALQELRR